jgi:RNA polymerase sigma factor (TIGR02999 family)
MAGNKDDTRGLAGLLDQLNGGHPGAFAKLVDTVYDDLRRIAANRMAGRFDRPVAALTVQPTAIANDAVMKLHQQRQQFQNPEHFFAIATRLIEYLISDYRKRRVAKKRGGGQRGASIEQVALANDLPAPDIHDSSDITHVLSKLHQEHPRKAEVVTLHIICEHPLPKVAELLKISLTSVERDWRFAKDWLKRELRKAPR